MRGKAYRESCQFAADWENTAIRVGELGFEGMFEAGTEFVTIAVAEEAICEGKSTGSDETVHASKV